LQHNDITLLPDIVEHVFPEYAMLIAVAGLVFLVADPLRLPAVMV
jgi:hypothetical protein